MEPPKEIISRCHSLTPGQVALSNCWCYFWTGEDEDDESFKEDLWVSAEHLKTNSHIELWTKCLETYELYPPECRGGPLMLMLILEQIQSTTESALCHLMTVFTSLKITAYV